MSKIGLFYGSTTGNTENAAKSIQKKVGTDTVALYNVADISTNDLNAYDFLIFGTSTWGFGELQDDWAALDIEDFDFSGKTVALFGLGDQECYADTFVDGMGILYSKVTNSGGTVIGRVSCNGYIHSNSLAVVDGEFVGLPLDDDNQHELTDERISNWINVLQKHM